LISIPTFLLLDHGFYFILFLKGSANSLIILYEILLDYINIIAYFLRIFIQLVRLLIIFIGLYTFNELFIEYYYYYFNFYNMYVFQSNYYIFLNFFFFFFFCFFFFIFFFSAMYSLQYNGFMVIPIFIYYVFFRNFRILLFTKKY